MALFKSVEEMINQAEEKNLPLWEYIWKASAEEEGLTQEQSWAQMEKSYDTMVECYESYDPDEKTPSGMVGGDAEKIRKFRDSGKAMLGPYIDSVISTALSVGECNACMHRILAAPTAGSCGVMPAVFLPYQREHNTPKEEFVKAMYIAAGFGAVIATRASLAGSQGGCQAEIGSAAAMSAAALVQLQGGTNAQMGHAAAIVFKNMMGLVCDPVAGLVEVPCVKRNVAGAMNALAAAEMALAGIESQIPVDEVIDTMGIVGRMLPPALRETAEGGVAVTPTAMAITKRLK